MTPARAQELNQVDILLGPLSYYGVSRDDRQAAAQHFETLCQDYLKKLPRLSPREVDWLEREIKAGRTKGLPRTLEFAKRRLRNKFDRCLTGAKAARNGIDLQTQVLGWAIISSSLIDMDFEYNLRTVQEEAGLSEGEIVEVGLFPWLAEKMMDNIVVAYLANQLPEQLLRPPF